MVDEKKVVTPKWAQNLVKTLYLVAFSMILFIVFVVVAFFMKYPLTNYSYTAGLYASANAIMTFLVLNENIKLPEYKW